MLYNILIEISGFKDKDVLNKTDQKSIVDSLCFGLTGKADIDYIHNDKTVILKIIQREIDDTIEFHRKYSDILRNISKSLWLTIKWVPQDGWSNTATETVTDRDTGDIYIDTLNENDEVINSQLVKNS